MKINILVWTIATVLFLSFTTSYAAELVIGEKELLVTGKNIEFNTNETLVIVSDKVKAVSPNFTLWCDHLTVIYNNDKKQKQTDNAPINQTLEEVHATGNVIIDTNSGYTSTSEKLIFLKDKQELILSGNAIVRSAANQVRGCLIRYNLSDQSYSVESCENEQAGVNIQEPK